MSAVHQAIVAYFKGLLFVGTYFRQLPMAQMPYGTVFHREAKAAEQVSEFLGLRSVSCLFSILD